MVCWREQGLKKRNEFGKVRGTMAFGRFERPYIATLLVVFGFASTAMGQLGTGRTTTANNGQLLTLQRALELALERNGTIKRALSSSQKLLLAIATTAIELSETSMSLPNKKAEAAPLALLGGYWTWANANGRF
jgi:hypothetical protein